MQLPIAQQLLATAHMETINSKEHKRQAKHSAKCASQWKHKNGLQEIQTHT